jgi:hypothetical protein
VLEQPRILTIVTASRISSFPISARASKR